MRFLVIWGITQNPGKYYQAEVSASAHNTEKLVFLDITKNLIIIVLLCIVSQNVLYERNLHSVVSEI